MFRKSTTRVTNSNHASKWKNSLLGFRGFCTMLARLHDLLCACTRGPADLHSTLAAAWTFDYLHQRKEAENQGQCAGSYVEGRPGDAEVCAHGYAKNSRQSANSTRLYSTAMPIPKTRCFLTRGPIKQRQDSATCKAVCETAAH